MAIEHILLTALGKQKTETLYKLGESTATARLTPLALIQLLPDGAKPTRVIALCTEGARQATWETFAEGVHTSLGIQAECVDIPDGQTEEEIHQIIERSAAKFPDEAELTLDVTQGLRHFPFVAYALALYLTSLRGIRLRGAYYGMLEGFPRDSKEPRPIVDLRPLLELPEWFHAVRVFRETGSTGPLAGLISDLASALRSEAQAAGNEPELHKRASDTEKLADLLQRFSFAYESAMPLELGKTATLLAKSLAASLPTKVSRRLPLANGLAEFVGGVLEPLAFPVPPTWKGKWKTRVANDAQELSRQAKLIDHYFGRKQLPLAMGLLREWVLSWVLHRQGNGRVWWSRDNRLRAEEQLGALAAALTSDLKGRLSDGQRTWAEFWSNLSELRNTLHHHGMRKDALEAAPTAAVRIQEFWGRLKKGTEELPTLGGGHGALLITALGTRPGVLYSALLAARPDRTLVICSEQSQPMIDEAAWRAGFVGPISRILVNDPHGGFDEMDRVRVEGAPILFEADHITANLTGGTTLMGLMVQQLVEAGSRLSRPYRRFALIDRRPPAEQDTEPWVQSGFYWLDGQQGKDHADD